MHDYAQVQLLGRVTTAPEFGSRNEQGKLSNAVITLALNIPIQRGGETHTKTIFRRVMTLGSFAGYVESCHNQDLQGLKGRLVVVTGVMDDEKYIEDGETYYQDVIRVAPGAGTIKIVDRRSQ